MIPELTYRYEPELDCYILLRDAFSDASRSSGVIHNLQQISQFFGIPLEELRPLAAEALALEKYILEHMEIPHERIAYYFQQEKNLDDAIATGFFMFHREKVRFQDLEPTQWRSESLRLIRSITTLSEDLFASVTCADQLFRLLCQQKASDRLLRVCMGIYIDPVFYQEEFETILARAVTLYGQMAHLLPDPRTQTFHTFTKNIGKAEEVQRLADINFDGGQNAVLYPSAFLFCNLQYLYDLSLAPSDPRFQALMGIGLWDDSITDLRAKYNSTVPNLSQQLKIISDSKRLELMGAIVDGAQSIEDLASRFSMSQNLVSYHLNQLVRESFLKMERRRAVNYYRIHYPAFRVLVHNLFHFIQMPKEEQEHAPDGSFQ